MVFVFEQKTAYEVRISDWSSDVCSSDLLFASSNNHALASSTGAGIDRANALEATSSAAPRLTIHFFILLLFSVFSSLQAATGSRPCDRLDRKSVVSGKSVTVSVDLGGPVIIKKNKKEQERRKRDK